MFYIHVEYMVNSILEGVYGPYSEEEAKQELLTKGWADVTILFGYCPTFVKNHNHNGQDLKATIRPLQKLGQN